MNPLNKRTAILIGLIFHAFYLWSIFDIYFVSPLVHGMRHFKSVLPTEEAPAQRLFLMVGDGLRADKAFLNLTHPRTKETAFLAPNLRQRAIEEGTFGISHTRMPTESRPGHVAMIAGFYEDVSAVTKGWKENPVDFDSVFNQSSHTWSYGSPDILPMFAYGADYGRVDAIMYDDDIEEDFTKSSIELDRFVFDKVYALFDEAATNSTLDAELRKPGIVFFLHLLGIDTAGHGYRPHSSEYYDNIQYIDTEIAKLEERINEFYEDDGKTAWVFTADHGMSDFGSHGDGHPDNTRTPLICWGSGINKPILGEEGHDAYSMEFQLPVQRHDVEQADIASLMSFLIGANYATNSVGKLPLDFVTADAFTKANALMNNAYSIAEQYIVKEDQVKSVQFNFKPYELDVESSRLNIEQLIESGDYESAIVASEKLIQEALRGMRYLQTYNWLLLRTLVTLGFIGWIVYATTSFMHQYVVPESSSGQSTKSPIIMRSVFVAIGAGLYGLLNFQNSPFMYYAYAGFPVFFWAVIFEHRKTLLAGSLKLINSSHQTKFGIVATLAISIGILEAIVCGYFHREVFSVCFMVAVSWPWIQDAQLARKNLTLSSLWAVLCMSMAMFTVLPAVKEENLPLIVSGGILMSTVSLWYIFKLRKVLALGTVSLIVAGVQLGLIILCTIVTISSVWSLQARNGLPFGNQVVSWAVLVLSITIPFLHHFSPISDFRFRLLTIFMTFAPAFVLLTIADEGMFYLTLFGMLMVWSEWEYIFHGSVKNKELSFSDLRLAMFYFFLSQIGFFGMGNVASVSSFQLDSVYRLLPIFDPFAMGALLVFKLLAPYAVLSAFLGILNLRLGLPVGALFSMLLSVSDILSLNFFYFVVDEGSWLDIGTGISHYSIAVCLCLFMLLLQFISSLLVSGVEIDSETAVDKKQD